METSSALPAWPPLVERLPDVIHRDQLWDLCLLWGRYAEAEARVLLSPLAAAEFLSCLPTIGWDNGYATKVLARANPNEEPYQTTVKVLAFSAGTYRALLHIANRRDTTPGQLVATRVTVMHSIAEAYRVALSYLLTCEERLKPIPLQILP